VAWSWYEIVLCQEVPFPSLADVGHLGAIPAGIAGLLCLPGAAGRLGARVRTALDGLVIGAARRATKVC